MKLLDAFLPEAVEEVSLPQAENNADSPDPENQPQIVYMSPRDLGSSPFDDIVNPPATPDEWEALRQSAREFGILNPLILWGDSGRSKPPVLAGNRRLKVALELDLESVPTISRDFPSREAAKQFAIRENTERREMTILTRTMAADELWRLFDKAADKKSSAAAGMPPRKRAALAAGVSEGTLAAFRFVKETGDGKLIADMLGEKFPISAAYKQAKLQVEGERSTGKPSTGSVKADKALDDLKAVMGILKKLPSLSEQIVKGLPKAVKKADREHFVKQLTSAKDFITTVRKDDYLGVLENAIMAAEAGVS